MPTRSFLASLLYFDEGRDVLPVALLEGHLHLVALAETLDGHTPSATVTRIPLSSTRVRSDVSTVWILPSISAAQAPTTENISRTVTTAHSHFAITRSSLRGA